MPAPLSLNSLPSRRKNGSDNPDWGNSGLEWPLTLEEPLRKLEDREYIFRYRFTSGGKDYTRKMTDWEVYAAWYNYKRRYGDKALEHMKNSYQYQLPSQNLHFILGTVKAHPHQFIIIGLLRSNLDLDFVNAQPSLL